MTIQFANIAGDKLMNQCHLCGCSVSQGESSCPACFTSLQPKEITWDEFVERLVKAGWTRPDAEKEVQTMQEDEESGL